MNNLNIKIGCSKTYSFTKNYRYVLIIYSTSSSANTSWSQTGMQMVSTSYLGGYGVELNYYWFENVQAGATISYYHASHISSEIAVLGIV